MTSYPTGQYLFEDDDFDFEDCDRHDPEIDRLVEFLNEHHKDQYSVAYEQEYITLYIRFNKITQGEPEVLQRLKDIKREQGLDCF
jgi:hypothetical protein